MQIPQDPLDNCYKSVPEWVLGKKENARAQPKNRKKKSPGRWSQKKKRPIFTPGCVFCTRYLIQFLDFSVG